MTTLVRRARSRDEAATDQLIRRAGRLAIATAAAVLGNREEAADIAQDVAIDVFRQLGSLRDPERFDAWVHRITIRRTLRVLKRRRTQHRSELSLSDPAHVAVAEGLRSGDRTADEIELRAAIREAMASLPEKQRVAVALKYVHGLKESEIAEVMGCRPGSIGPLISRARRTLQAHPMLADAALTVGDNR